MTQQDLINHLEAELRALLAEVRARFSAVPSDVLLQRPALTAWNALECFAHLNRYAETYIPRMELAMHKAKARQWAPGDQVRYTGRGKRAIRRADPENNKIYKSAKRYNFIQKPLGPEAIKSFIINSERILRVLQIAREVDLNKTKIKKANAWFGRYTLGNLLEFLVLHQKRHVRQALQAVDGVR